MQKNQIPYFRCMSYYYQLSVQKYGFYQRGLKTKMRIVALIVYIFHFPKTKKSTPVSQLRSCTKSKGGSTNHIPIILGGRVSLPW
ncbi:unnamed protein product [Phytomonas sp. Hart1]|nr:unnamed protein product [Phytomonas sp. Hart1]|eukprot:CCW67829.1 unnamed protein product [Phytomonas sp. isolate Hart1]